MAGWPQLLDELAHAGRDKETIVRQSDGVVDALQRHLSRCEQVIEID